MGRIRGSALALAAAGLSVLAGCSTPITPLHPRGESVPRRTVTPSPTSTPVPSPTATPDPTPSDCCSVAWNSGNLGGEMRGVAAGAEWVYEVHRSGSGAVIGKYSRAGAFQGYVPIPAGSITWDVSDMTMGPDGLLYLGDRPAWRIYVVNPLTGIVGTLSGIDKLSPLYVDPTNVLYVTSEAGLVRRFEKRCDGTGWIKKGEGNLGLLGLGAVTRARGVLYAASPAYGVWSVTETPLAGGTWTYGAGACLVPAGSAVSLVSDAFDLASDAEGNLYVEGADGIKKYAVTAGGSAVYLGRCAGGQQRFDIGASDGRLYVADMSSLSAKSPCYAVGGRPAPASPFCFGM